jgi:hypothetical protein
MRGVDSEMGEKDESRQIVQGREKEGSKNGAKRCSEGTCVNWSTLLNGDLKVNRGRSRRDGEAGATDSEMG